ncbi:MAG: GHMP kinase [Candidatus Diapherotrites archaeon]|nr:GHMP kinase [Candidatus Diapherotrites archaeon]
MTTATKIEQGFEDIALQMKKDNDEIVKEVKKNYTIQDYPAIEKKNKLDGIAVAQAYPIQGILKYHGMSDWNYRTAYLPSISVNNDAARTVTYVKFDSNYTQDKGVINDKVVSGRDLERVVQTLDMVRKLTGATTKALVVSKNIVRATKTGKGLGTSASGSAAIGTAAVAAAMGDSYYQNKRFLSCIGRFLAGSGCRSIAGGISLWLSYPGIAHEDSYAVRLDDQEQLKDVSLITVPVDSRIGLKTETAHKDAPHSPLFKKWMEMRKPYILECMQAVQKGDWQTVARLGELDTILLHGVTMSGTLESKIIAWEPETIQLMRASNELKDSGIPCYYSIDTGPTPVFITPKKYETEVVDKIAKLKFEYVVGKIAGPAELLNEEKAEEILQVSKYDN